MVKGIMKTLRQEDTTKLLFSLKDITYTEAGARAITQVTSRWLVEGKDEREAARKEQDFVFSHGLLQVPRLRVMPTARDAFAAEAGFSTAVMQPLMRDDADDNDSLELTADAAGSMDSIYFRRNPNILSRPLGEDEIVVRVSAAGVNFRDLLLMLGSLPWAPPGFEGAGTVIRVGSKVRNLQVGDRVFYFVLGGGMATHVQLTALNACKIPDELSEREAASLPIAYTTAVMCVQQIARIRTGETILIHAGAGATGQACIALAQSLGAKVFATAGSPEKRDFVHSLGVPRSQIFSSRDSSFRDGIIRATKGRGVDVIINSLSDQLLRDTWALIGKFGRFVEIGKKDIQQNNHLSMRPFNQNVAFTGLDCLLYFTEKPNALQECLSEVLKLLQARKIKPIQPITALPPSQIASGLRKLQSGRGMGKFVVTFNGPDTVMAEPRNSLTTVSGSLLRPDATYLITGGTGGIGRSLAIWMFDNGAKNVVLLGRTGGSRPDVAKLLKRYEDDSEHNLIALACDVGVKESLATALASLDGRPPIRGVIHSALYLRDALFVNNTFEDWKAITAPKINAAWHLNELIHDLDFFVSLSSVDAVTGNVGQSIYSGTSTFLDAFTTHRRARGLPATCISLPVVEDFGYAVDKGLSGTLRHSIGAWVTGSQVHTLVKAAIIGPSSGIVAQDGRCFAFATTALTKDAPELPWEFANSIAAMRRKPAPGSDEYLALSFGQGAARDELHVDGDSEDAAQRIIRLLSAKVCEMTLLEPDEVTPDRSLIDYGIDSLVAVELRNWIRREFRVELALNQIVSRANLLALAELIQTERK